MTANTGPASLINTLRRYLADESLYEIQPPLPAHPGVGRPRKNPYWVWMLFNQFVTVTRSVRAVEREFATPEVWKIIQDEGRRRFPDDWSMWPTTPMRRHEFTHLLDLNASTDANLTQVRDDAEVPACAMAVEAGLLTGKHGTVQFPGKSDCLHADGVVVRQLYGPVDADQEKDRAKETEERRPSDSDGNSVQPRRSDPDARKHKTGTGKNLYGTKFAKLLTRGTDPGSRFLLAVEHVPGENEGQAALDMLRRTLPRVPKASAFLYDGALRGVHHNEILTTMGVIPISPMHAASGAKGSGKPRVEKRILVQTAAVKGGRSESCPVFAEGGAAGVLLHDVAGNEYFEPLRQKSVYSRPNRDGTWRWYADYELPASAGGGTITTFPHYNTAEDRKRRFNRTENLRLFPKGSKQYDTLYGRRSDAESSNQNLKNSLWIDRAHCLGARRQLLMMYGYQRAVNAMAIARVRAQSEPLQATAA